MKKLLYVITLPDWGGAQRYVLDLAENMRNDFEVTVAFGQQEKNRDLADRCKESEIATYQFKNLVRPISWRRDFAAVSEIANYIKTAKPDIIHLNSSKAGVLGSFAAKMAGSRAKIIYTVHGWVFFEPMNAIKKKIYILAERLASYSRDIIIVLGERAKQTAEEYRIAPAEKIKIIRNAITSIKFLSKAEARANLGLPSDAKIVGTIANFFKAKGLQYLIEAAAKSLNNDIIYAIIGDGSMKDELEAAVHSAGLEKKIMFLGARENASKYLYAFDVFTLPSVKEGMPYVVLEAMHAGLPIVATDVGDVAEMLNDYDNKILVTPGNADSLGEAIVAAMEKSASTNPRQASLDVFLKQMREIYNSADSRQTTD
jgi:glycosyltransferase involved in cell wall biosynthesis